MRMKVFTAVSALAVVFGMTACSDNDDAGTSGGNLEGSQFMGVEVINATQGLQGNGAKKNALTRADNERGDSGSYNNGTVNESTLSSARFIFFDANGNLVTMANNRQYADVETFARTSGADNTQTIERKYATVVLNPVQGSVPAQTMVVGNINSIPDDEQNAFRNINSFDLNSLLNRGQVNLTVKELYKTDNSNKKDFIMSSTVYANSNNNIMSPASTAGKITNDSTLALNNPVQVYVERVAAKVDASTTDNTRWIHVQRNQNGTYQETSDVTGANAYQIYKKDDHNSPSFVLANGTTTKYDVIAVVRGIGLADEMGQAYLFKNISGGLSENWDPDGSGTKGNLGFPFSISNFHRSFWETTPGQDAQGARVNHSWTDYTDGKTFPQNLNGTPMYTFPNTPSLSMWQAGETEGQNQVAYWNYNNSQTRLTKLLLATQLYVNTNDDPEYKVATIYQFGGQNYLDSVSTKNAIASTLPIIVGVRDASSKAIKSWRTISPEDFTIVSPANNQADQGQYMETLKIEAPKDSLKTGEEYIYARGSITTGATTSADIAEQFYTNENSGQTLAENYVNNQAQYKPIIYKDGMSYYYTTIRHLSPEPAAGTQPKLGYYGVVRNHEYNIKVNSLGGFGTAVYDPSNTIIPVTPTNKNTYMAAQINVLQWRVVNQTVDINTENPNPSK